MKSLGFKKTIMKNLLMKEFGFWWKIYNQRQRFNQDIDYQKGISLN